MPRGKAQAGTPRGRRVVGTPSRSPIPGSPITTRSGAVHPRPNFAAVAHRAGGAHYVPPARRTQSTEDVPPGLPPITRTSSPTSQRPVAQVGANTNATEAPALASQGVASASAAVLNPPVVSTLTEAGHGVPQANPSGVNLTQTSTVPSEPVVPNSGPSGSRPLPHVSNDLGGGLPVTETITKSTEGNAQRTDSGPTVTRPPNVQNENTLPEGYLSQPRADGTQLTDLERAIRGKAPASQTAGPSRIPYGAPPVSREDLEYLQQQLTEQLQDERARSLGLNDTVESLREVMAEMHAAMRDMQRKVHDLTGYLYSEPNDAEEEEQPPSPGDGGNGSEPELPKDIHGPPEVPTSQPGTQNRGRQGTGITRAPRRGSDDSSSSSSSSSGSDGPGAGADNPSNVGLQGPPANVHESGSHPANDHQNPQGAAPASHHRQDGGQSVSDLMTGVQQKPLPRKGRIDKIRELPKLGGERNQLPYLQWRYNVFSAVDSAQAGWVLVGPCPLWADSKQKHWFARANAMVFDALFTTVQDISVLVSRLNDFIGDPASASKAWAAIKEHYVRRAETTKPFLEQKLRRLEPHPNETMEGFLSRAQALRREWEAYGIELPDKDLIVQIFTHLSLTWRQGTAIRDKFPEDMSWGEVSEYLRKEDVLRRQANTKAPDALLPLGWHKGGGDPKPHVKTGPTHGKAATSQGKPKPAQEITPSEEPQGGAAAAKGKGKFKSSNKKSMIAPNQQGESKATGQKTPTPKGGDKSQTKRVLVCYYPSCHKGHVWTNCPSKPSDWQPSAEHKKVADDIRRRRIEQSKADKASYAHAKAVQGQGESSSDPDPPSSSHGNAAPSRGASGSTSGDKSTGHVTLPNV